MGQAGFGGTGETCVQLRCPVTQASSLFAPQWFADWQVEEAGRMVPIGESGLGGLWASVCAGGPWARGGQGEQGRRGTLDWTRHILHADGAAEAGGQGDAALLTLVADISKTSCGVGLQARVAVCCHVLLLHLGTSLRGRRGQPTAKTEKWGPAWRASGCTQHRQFCCRCTCSATTSCRQAWDIWTPRPLGLVSPPHHAGAGLLWPGRPPGRGVVSGSVILLRYSEGLGPLLSPSPALPAPPPLPSPLPHPVPSLALSPLRQILGLGISEGRLVRSWNKSASAVLGCFFLINRDEQSQPPSVALHET